MGWTYGENERQQIDQPLHIVAIQEKAKIKRTIKQDDLVKKEETAWSRTVLDRQVEGSYGGLDGQCVSEMKGRQSV